MITCRVMITPVALVVLMMSACQSHGGGGAQPAALAAADAETIGQVKLALAKAMGVANVELGVGDPTIVSTLSVLPPRPTPLEDRSLVQPTHFDLVLNKGRCLAVRRDTGEAYDLEGVTCRPLQE